MKKKAPFETWAQELLKRYKTILRLDHFHPLQLEFKKGHPGAECQFYYPYSSITVRYGESIKEYYDEGNEEMATKILVHELCHAITDAFYAKSVNQWRSKEEIEDERERLTDHIANIVLSL